MLCLLLWLLLFYFLHFLDGSAHAQITKWIAEERSSQLKDFYPKTSIMLSDALFLPNMSILVNIELIRWKLEYVQTLHLFYNLRYINVYLLHRSNCCNNKTSELRTPWEMGVYVYLICL